MTIRTRGTWPAIVGAAALIVGGGAASGAGDAGLPAPGPAVGAQAETTPATGPPKVLLFTVAPSTSGFALPSGRRGDITFGVQIDRGAIALLRVSQVLPGRRSGTACVAATRALVRAGAGGCVREVTLGILRRRLAALEEFVFIIERARIGTRTLGPGRYRARLTATTAGRASRPSTVGFRILPPQG